VNFSQCEDREDINIKKSGTLKKPLPPNVWIEKLRLSTFENNRKLKLSHLLHGLSNSRSFNGLERFSDLDHQALYFEQ
jgi:hypothetical protein